MSTQGTRTFGESGEERASRRMRGERTLDTPSLQDALVAAREEIPSGTVVQDRWYDRERNVRPNFVAAFVLVTLAVVLTLTASAAAAFTPASVFTLIAVGALALLGSLGVIIGSWSNEPVSPIPRMLLAGSAGVAFIALAVWALTL